MKVVVENCIWTSSLGESCVLKTLWAYGVDPAEKKKWGIYGGRWWKASEFTIRSKEDIPVLQRSSSRGKKNMQQTWVNLVYRATQEYHNQSARPIGCQEYLIITVRRNAKIQHKHIETVVVMGKLVS